MNDVITALRRVVDDLASENLLALVDSGMSGGLTVKEVVYRGGTARRCRMQLTIQGGRLLPEWVLEFLGMGRGPALPAFFCTDAFGRHVTIIGFDEDLFHEIDDADDDTAAGAAVPVEKFPVTVMGWPEDWAKDHSLRETIRIDPRGLPPAEQVEQMRCTARSRTSGSSRSCSSASPSNASPTPASSAKRELRHRP